MLVFLNGTVFLELRLIIPEGEELFTEVPQVIATDTETQETIGEYQLDWKGPPIENENNTKEDDSHRLLGLAGSTPMTIYRSLAIVNFESANLIEVKLPVFRTKEN